jgi:hypothetical protein
MDYTNGKACSELELKLISFYLEGRNFVETLVNVLVNVSIIISTVIKPGPFTRELEPLFYSQFAYALHCEPAKNQMAYHYRVMNETLVRGQLALASVTFQYSLTIR